GLYELQPKDQNNNVVQADALLYDTRNTFVKVNSGKLVVVHGLDNYLINESDNVLLICKLDAENRFREFFGDAKNKGEGFVYPSLCLGVFTRHRNGHYYSSSRKGYR